MAKLDYKTATIFIDGMPLGEVGGDVDLGLGPPKGEMKKTLDKAKGTPPMQIKVDFSRPLFIEPEIEALLLEWMEGN